MADPVSITLGVAGIIGPVLHGARLLIDDIVRVSNAPEAIRTLREDLGSTVQGLEALQGITEAGWQSIGSEVAEHSKRVVRSCGSACQNFRDDLLRWTKRSQGGKLSWRDRAKIGLFKEPQIKAMSGHLQSCKLNCTFVVGTANLYTSLRNGQMTEELKIAIQESRTNLASAATRNEEDIIRISETLTELSLIDPASANEDDAEEKESAAAQLAEQKTASEVCKALIADLQSLYQDDKIQKLAAETGSNVRATFGNVTGGIGVGISNAPINATFGDSYSSK